MVKISAIETARTVFSAYPHEAIAVLRYTLYPICRETFDYANIFEMEWLRDQT
jgi:hypothetical protein